jgi:hypothetical protein
MFLRDTVLRSLTGIVGELTKLFVAGSNLNEKRLARSVPSISLFEISLRRSAYSFAPLVSG